MDLMDNDFLTTRGLKGKPSSEELYRKSVYDALVSHPHSAFGTKKGFHTALGAPNRFFETKVNGYNYHTILRNFVNNKNIQKVVVPIPQ
jgi:hypothetical protein